ncbi:MAG: hypothetical protein O3B73_05100 [bacterium]|nr:hypothetical protein [bacterium]
MNFSRRKAIASMGLGGVALAETIFARESPMTADTNGSLRRYPTVLALKSQSSLKEGDWAETAGFYAPGDGGAAWYRIQKSSTTLSPNDADILDVGRQLIAVLQEKRAVNYKMFGAPGDGDHNDGVQIKLAHEYANRHRVPVVNLSGEFWIRQTHNIPIVTSVTWGQTIFHIDEKFNEKRSPRFIVHNDEPKITLTQNTALKSALLKKLKPGVQIIPELAAYAGHLFMVEDENDRIGIRAGNYQKRGWAREELFYVEEEGRIIGDIAWPFQDFTAITATPCNDNFLIIEGGGFYFSGDSGEDGSGYHQHGITIERSRTIIREQWMGLEKGKSDISMQPRSGFYTFKGVYDVTLENIRAMPWEKIRKDNTRVLAAGTYGIGGARMLNCTFRNLTAEGGPVAWGVFGTNLNKNFRVENCRLNRIDVHFHCWNLTISNCTIGFKGIALTGGGDLIIENTIRHGNQFVNFRSDYGAKWDGHIQLRGCTLKPSSKGNTSIFQHRMSNFDYQYPIGFAKTIKVQDLVIDYSAVPTSKSPCYLMDIVPFSRTDQGARLFFPSRAEFQNVTVEGRDQGVRLMRIPSPYHFDVGKKGSYTKSQLQTNSTLIFDNVQLEKLAPESVGDTEQVHLLLGDPDAQDYADASALYPAIRFVDCDHVCVYLGHVIANVSFERCRINTLSAAHLRGELDFDGCHFMPRVKEASAKYYPLQATLGTRFTNSRVHAPVVNGKTEPGQINQIGFLEINKSVQYHHLNTALGNDILTHLKKTGRTLTPRFIAKLKSHHELEN